ncbi:helix-turn-helix transcriptional regulator [Akkermansiaceae bacterium]|nr:helix-turn-helix transcriptional regulator [Akkermansiaceae bacterium]
MVANERKNDWRSPCPVCRVLEILGDKWSLLVVRDLMLGRTRFKEFMASPEGIPTNILTERLNRLVEHGIIEKALVSEGSKRFAYLLTDKGKALRPVLKSIMKWGLEHEEGTRVGLSKSG